MKPVRIANLTLPGRRNTWLLAIGIGLVSQVVVSGMALAWLASGSESHPGAARLLLGELLLALFGIAALTYAFRWMPRSSGATFVVPIVYVAGAIYLLTLGLIEPSYLASQYASVADFSSPSDLVMSPEGDLYVLDWYEADVKVVAGDTGRITSLPLQYTDPAVDQGLSLPRSMEPYIGESVIIADTGNDVLRLLDLASGTITRFAGSGARGFSRDGGPAVEASLMGPRGVAVDEYGNVFFVDAGNRRVRRIDAVTRVITTIAGNGEAGSTGDGGSALNASLASPRSVVVDRNGDLFVLDQGSNRVRRIDRETGLITAYAGTDEPGFSGDGGPAALAQLWSPRDIALDAAGNLYIADQLNHRIRRVEAASGIIDTVVGTGAIGRFSGFYGGDGVPATEAFLSNPSAISIGSDGSLHIVDEGNHLVRRVDRATGIIETVFAKRRPSR